MTNFKDNKHDGIRPNEAGGLRIEVGDISLGATKNSTSSEVDFRVTEDPIKNESFDPNFRGLIISEPLGLSTAGSSMVSQSSQMDPQALRSYVLFWDKIDIPWQNIIGGSLGPDIDFLLTTKSAFRTKFQCSGQGTGADWVDFIRKINGLTVQHRENLGQPGWAVGGSSSDKVLSASDLVPDRGLIVGLHKCIPVPNKDVPLQDILDFKEKRRDELLRLRHHLEELYQSIINGKDLQQASLTQFAKLQTAIDDHIQVTKEEGFKLRLLQLDVSFNLLAPPAGWVAAELTNADHLTSIVGATLGGLSLTKGFQFKKRTEPTSPFQYISNFHKELFWEP